MASASELDGLGDSNSVPGGSAKVFPNGATGYRPPRPDSGGRRSNQVAGEARAGAGVHQQSFCGVCARDYPRVNRASWTQKEMTGSEIARVSKMLPASPSRRHIKNLDHAANRHDFILRPGQPAARSNARARLIIRASRARIKRRLGASDGLLLTRVLFTGLRETCVPGRLILRTGHAVEQSRFSVRRGKADARKLLLV